MAYPTRYELSYSFDDFQQVNPTTPLPADKLEIELNNLALTTDQIIDNLSVIQRSDGALANASVGIDQLKSEVSIGINDVSTWITAKAYVVNNAVYFGYSVYRCIVSHTSGVFLTDLASGKWLLVVDMQTPVNAASASASAASASASAASASATAAANSVAALFGTSTTSNTIGTGTKTFTTQTGKSFTTGTYVIIANQADATKFMTGVVTSYSGSTLQVSVDSTNGSGTLASWVIQISGVRGATGPTGPAGPGSGDMLKANNLSDLVSASSARGNLGLQSAATATIQEIRLVPQNSKSADYTLVSADAGYHIFHPAADANARTFTIPSNASVGYTIGTAITFVNMSVNDVTIAITSDTLMLAGVGTTGSRTLKRYGSATALKISATEWVISGVGLT